MNVFPTILTPPHRAVIETENGRVCLAGGAKVVYEDMELTCEGGKVTLTAQTAGVRFVRLCWEAPLPEDSRFLGDAWERGYGEFEWRGFVFDRAMPWYFFALSGETLAGYGVKTGPDAMCSFTCDPHGITLHLDVRCGMLPANGVYAAFAVVGNERFPAVVNIGVAPTFDSYGNGGQVRVEAHLLTDGAPDLYGKEMALGFAARIRGEHKFGSPEELAARIPEDIRLARAALNEQEPSSAKEELIPS